MGLNELIEQRGRPYTREFIRLQGLPTSSIGNYNILPSSFVLLGMTVSSTPTRVRLYSTSQSVQLDASRPVSSFDFAVGVGLAAEAYFASGQNSLKFDPPILCTSAEGNPTFWYNVSGSANGNSVTFEVLPLAEPASATGRSTYTIQHNGVANTGDGVTGTINTPKGYLLVSASATVSSRLRLYSTPISEVSAAETARAFGDEPPSGSKLIVDLMIDTPNAAYPISPTLAGMTWTGTVYEVGTGVTGYRLQNISGTSPSDITATISVYSLED